MFVDDKKLRSDSEDEVLFFAVMCPPEDHERMIIGLVWSASRRRQQLLLHCLSAAYLFFRVPILIF